MKAVFKQSIPLKIRFLEGFLVSLPGIPSLPLFWEKGWKGAENLCPYLVSLPVVFEGRATTQVFLRKTFLVSLPVVFVRTQTKNVKLVSFQKKKAFWNKKYLFKKKKPFFVCVVALPSKRFFFVNHFLKRYKLCVVALPSKRFFFCQPFFEKIHFFAPFLGKGVKRDR